MTGPLDVVSQEHREHLRPAEVPRRVEPMLATLVHEPFSDPDWIFERKLDGQRCLVRRDGGDPQLLSRSGEHLDGTSPELIDPLAGSTSNHFVVDGEVVAFEGSLTSFSRLQRRLGITDPDEARASGVAVRFYLFDVLHVDGHDTTALPLRQRKRVLKALFDFADPLRFTAHRVGDGEELLADACDRGWEGLIAKDATATYVHTRSRRWLKLKCVARQELVIGGFTEPGGQRTGFGAILVGYHDGDDLVYAGKVGTGFDDETLRELGARMAGAERATSPFDRGDPPERGTHWVTPDLVAEIAFTEWTDAGRLRHPRYLGLRHDKPAAEVVREDPS
ncbi:MAG TPA: non-homologous end-joining DNA ligase [Acidimicrobiales bacterium]|nr:non-homologous end-joining DNA ligase [Acidimicrobiales bacterium]